MENNFRQAVQNFPAVPQGFFPVINEKMGMLRIRAAAYINTKKEKGIMNWIYFAKLFRTRFQAGCLAKRLEQDGWIYGYHDPRFVEIYRSRKGRYGVRFLP
ncbi:hypothetical protein QW71_23110 [Paenibacillus sp. IHB B 3415]|nr:hypothetical protein QW71_23110 [Paenibacillus sp. IHB B 3415]